MTTSRKDIRAQEALSGSHNGGTVTLNGTLNTTDDGFSGILIIQVEEGEALLMEGHVIASIDDESASLGATFSGTFRRAVAGDVTAVGVPIVTTVEDSAGTPTVELIANTFLQGVQIRIRGVVAENWRWETSLSYTKV